MKDFFILNPVAGSEKSRKNAIPEGITPYLTTGVGDCTRYVMSVCETTPDPRFHISGGDGTLNEAVTGVMRANEAETISSARSRENTACFRRTSFPSTTGTAST